MKWAKKISHFVKRLLKTGDPLTLNFLYRITYRGTPIDARSLHPILRQSQSRSIILALAAHISAFVQYLSIQ